VLPRGVPRAGLRVADHDGAGWVYRRGEELLQRTGRAAVQPVHVVLRVRIAVLYQADLGVPLQLEREAGSLGAVCAGRCVGRACARAVCTHSRLR
jgi:hypothetical protein